MKKSDDFNSDKLLREKLGEGSAAVPEFVWDRIESRIRPEKRKRRLFWWFLLLFCAAGSFLMARTLVFHGGQSIKTQHGLHTATHNCNRPRPENTTTLAKKMQSGNDLTTTSLSGDRKQSLRKLKTADNNATANPGRKPSQKAKNKLPETEDKTAAERASNKSLSIIPADITSEEKQTARTAESLQTETAGDTTTPGLTVTALIPRAIYPDVPAALLATRAAETSGKQRFEIAAYGGLSLFDIAVFKDYFTSGQLSNRNFPSKGFETGLQAQLNVKRFGFYAGLAFNTKTSGFVYDVAVKQSVYFGYAAEGETIPLEDVEDNAPENCFVVHDVSSRYRIYTALLSAGARFSFIDRPKFSIAADLRFSTNLQTSFDMLEMTKIDVDQPENERFSYFQPGIGLQATYRFGNRFAVGVNPVWSRQLGTNSRSFYKNLSELLVPVSFHYNF